MISLTPSEAKFAGLVVAGLSSEEISKVTGASRDSVKSIMWRVRKKVGAENNRQLVQMFQTKLTQNHLSKGA